MGGPEPARDVQTIVVEIDHDNLGGEIELGGQQGGQADRPGADDGHGRARSDLAVEDAAFEARRQDVAEHHHSPLVRALGDRIETGLGMGDADVFRLGSVDRIAQDPAASGAVGIHAPAAVLALAAG